MKNIITFLKRSNGSSRFFNALRILYTILGFPAFMFHELCHVIVCILFGVKFEVVEFCVLKIVTDPEDPENLGLKTCLAIKTKTRHWWQAFIISMAPLIGGLILVVTLLFLPASLPLLGVIWYMIFWRGTFMPSDQDFKSARFALEQRMRAKFERGVAEVASDVLGMSIEQFLQRLKEDPEGLQALIEDKKKEFEIERKKLQDERERLAGL